MCGIVRSLLQHLDNIFRLSAARIAFGLQEREQSWLVLQCRETKPVESHLPLLSHLVQLYSELWAFSLHGRK